MQNFLAKKRHNNVEHGRCNEVKRYTVADQRSQIAVLPDVSKSLPEVLSVGLQLCAAPLSPAEFLLRETNEHFRKSRKEEAGAVDGKYAGVACQPHKERTEARANNPRSTAREVVADISGSELFPFYHAGDRGGNSRAKQHTAYR